MTGCATPGAAWVCWSRALLPYCGHVTAIDRSPAAIADLTARGHDPPADGPDRGHPGPAAQKPYDAMVFCLFSGTDEILDIAARQCGGTALVVRRDFRQHQFSSGGRMAGHRRRHGAGAAPRGLTCTLRRFTLEFGQPFRSVEDALAFFRLYSRDGTAPARQELEARLEPSPGRTIPCICPIPAPVPAGHPGGSAEGGFPWIKYSSAAPGWGKAPLIRRLTALYPGPVSGFVTKRETVADGEGLFPIYIHPAACPEARRQYGPENLIGRCDSRRSVRCTSALMTGDPGWEGPGLLLMDELGFLERDAHRFQEAVLAALKGDQPVLAAVKNRNDLFLQAVRGVPGVRVLYITRENRRPVPPAGAGPCTGRIITKTAVGFACLVFILFTKSTTGSAGG